MIRMPNGGSLSEGRKTAGNMQRLLSDIQPTELALFKTRPFDRIASPGS